MYYALVETIDMNSVTVEIIMNAYEPLLANEKIKIPGRILDHIGRKIHTESEIRRKRDDKLLAKAKGIFILLNKNN